VSEAAGNRAGLPLGGGANSPAAGGARLPLELVGGRLLLEQAALVEDEQDGEGG
jgi:hypothetical protein